MNLQATASTACMSAVNNIFNLCIMLTKMRGTQLTAVNIH